MSVHFLSGKPGGGKSLYAMRLVLDELIYGTRPVYTNLPIDLGALAEFIQREHWNERKVFHVADRVRVFSDEEAGSFWTHRPGIVLPVLDKKDWSSGKLPDYAGITDSGVFYVIDEIHNYFNARAWAETGRDVLFYLSQHRKLGDTVIAVTQAVGNVDKQFRSVSQDYTYLRNVGKEKYGIFRLPRVFVRQTYGSPATDTSTPLETGTFRLDVRGIASCYSTAVGVGIHGKAADKTERRGGPSWLWAVIIVPLVLVCGMAVAPKALVGLIAPKGAGGARVPSALTSQGVPMTVAPTGVVARAEGIVTAKVTDPRLAPGRRVFMAGYDKLTGRYRILLTDGRTYWEKDGHVQLLTSDGCQIDGVYYALATLDDVQRERWNDNRRQTVKGFNNDNSRFSY